MHPEELRKIYAKQAISHDKRSDSHIWISAAFCAKVVGKYDRGATLGLAEDMSRSPDTIEDRAHGYWMFEKLCKISKNQKIRQYVFNCRRAPWIHFSHFRELYDQQQAHHLTDEQILSILNDIYQAEGGISSRNLGDHIRKVFGDTRDWTYYGAKAHKELDKTLSQPDLPNRSEAVGLIFYVAISSKTNIGKYHVVAYTKIQSEKTARKIFAVEFGEDDEKNAKCVTNEEIDVAIAESRHFLNVTSSWLGDHA